MSTIETNVVEASQSAPARSAHRRRRIGADAISTAAALAIFVAMLIYGEVVYGRIFQYSTISNLLINNAHLVILAVGLTFVILTGGIDLSVGAVIAVSSVTGVILTQHGWNPYLVLLIMVAIGALSGLVAATLIEVFEMQPFIATLAMMFLARGIASTLSTVPERLDPDAQKVLRANVAQLYEESDAYPIYEGRIGASPREMRVVLLDAAQSARVRDAFSATPVTAEAATPLAIAA